MVADPPRSRLPLLVIGLMLGIGLVAAFLLLRSNAAPDLTQADLDSARRRWSEYGPSSYTLELQMGGALSDLRLIVVKEGRVVEMTVDGQASAESAWEYWSVDGLLQAMQDELWNAADPPPSLGVSDGSQIVLRARFDPELGYPTHFFRHLLGRQQGTEWTVVRFDSAH